MRPDSSSARFISRRDFTLRSAVVAAGLTTCAGQPFPLAATGEPRKAAIIGHTGRGNYGHGLDEIFSGLPGINVVAVADPEPEGRAKALARTRAKQGYENYRQMLEAERPHLVAVSPRHTDQHHAMTSAALRAGAHVYSEKPFTTSLAEADELMKLAERSGLKIAVAHQMRLAPSVIHLKQRIDAGDLGELVAIRSHGKQDQRAGGEDLIVLGTHLFDLMRFFGGEVECCSASIREKGKQATASMTRLVADKIGPVLGDEIEARFDFANGIVGTFTSNAKLRETLGPWGMELLGSKGAALILMDIFPKVFIRKKFETGPAFRSEFWEQQPGDPTRNAPESERGFATANRRVVLDWLQAIEENREPLCSAKSATKAIEMAMAVHASGVSGQRVQLPLTTRSHPLERGAR